VLPAGGASAASVGSFHSRTDVMDDNGENDNRILQSALEYASRGWCVVPLGKASKAPRVKEWQNNSSTDEDQITRWWDRWPEANVGVQLGPRSRIIDIECDSEEAEQDYQQVFENAGVPLPIVPTFRGARGKHRLFEWREDLPPGAVIHLGNMEVRLGNTDKGAQSVFPPSIHPSGARYEWLVPPDDTPVGHVPAPLLGALWNLQGDDVAQPLSATAKPAEHWMGILEGVAEGSRNKTATELIGYRLAKIDVFDNAAVAVELAFIRIWNRSNTPPMLDGELEKTYESILKREQHQRVNADANCEGSRQILYSRKSAEPKGEWRVVIVGSDPPRYKLFSPLWEGSLILTPSEYRTPSKIGVIALAQKEDVWIPDWFSKVWRKGTKDKPEPLGGALLRTADREETADESRRAYMVALMLYNQLIDNPKRVEPGEEYDSRGIPCVNDKGDYVFQFEEVHRAPSRSEYKIKTHEMTDLLEQIGANRGFRPKIAGSRPRRWILPTEGFAKLETIIHG
jgi:hypothetical protein